MNRWKYRIPHVTAADRDLWHLAEALLAWLWPDQPVAAALAGHRHAMALAITSEQVPPSLARSPKISRHRGRDATDISGVK